MHPTLIIRHRKENKKKCTLEPLTIQKKFLFFTYPKKLELPDLSSYFVLAIEGETPLSKEDQDKGLILLDGTWKYANQMYQHLFKDGKVPIRTLPSHVQTAYPRKQTHCLNPEQGLASIEALFIAYLELGWSTKGLLDHYHFRNSFLKKNGILDTCT